MGGPVFNIVFNSLSYSIMYFCFKLRSKYLWSPVPHCDRCSRQQVDELRMSCERSLGFQSDALSRYSILGFTVSTLSFPCLGCLLSSVALKWQPRVGYLTLTIRSVRLGLNVQTFRLAIHLNLFCGDSACAMRNRRRALRSSHSPPDSNLAVFSSRITKQKHLTHLSRVISLPNHDVCLEYSQTLYEFG